MPSYKAPLRDTRFLLNEVFDFPAHYRSLANGQDATPDMVDAILGECAKLCEEVIAPLYHSGDEEGCHLENGEVRTPKGYKEAYDAYVAGGWQGLSHPVEYGGQGLPMSLGALKQEMLGTANWPFSMYPGLSLGAMNTLMQHGTEEQKNTYLTPLTEGRWAGTMCLTEPQCGTDLGQVKTRAEANAAAATPSPAPRSSSPPGTTTSPRTSSISSSPACPTPPRAPVASPCSSCPSSSPAPTAASARATASAAARWRRRWGSRPRPPA